MMRHNGKYSINGYEYLVIFQYMILLRKNMKLEKEKNKKDIDNSLEKIKIEEMWLNDLDQLKNIFQNKNIIKKKNNLYKYFFIFFIFFL